MVGAIDTFEAPSRTTAMDIERALRSAPEATKGLLESRRLLRRMDTKFLLDAGQVAPVLERVVDRYAATRDTPYNRVFVRPKTPFGAR